MPEKIALTVPDQVKPGTPEYLPVALLLQWKLGYVELWVEGLNGETEIARWSDAAGEDATGMMRALNKANLNPATGGKTLLKRAMERALTDGKLPAGTITGTPD